MIFIKLFPPNYVGNHKKYIWIVPRAVGEQLKARNLHCDL